MSLSENSSNQLGLSPDLFNRAFPFHFAFNRDHQVVQAGEVLQRLAGGTLLGSPIGRHFTIDRPKLTADFDTLAQQSKSLFILTFRPNGMQLKGQMMFQAEGDLIFFLGSPWVTDTASLKPLGIKLKDFAIHDPVVDFLFLLQAKETALNDTQALTIELQRQRQELKTTLQFKENLMQVATQQAQRLEQSFRALQDTQTQLIQAEKMSSLGQMVAGVAHEINNPVNFISGNIEYVHRYTQDILAMIDLYQTAYPQATAEIAAWHDNDGDLDFIRADLPKILASMKMGADRIREIVLSLRNFSRLDEAEMKQVDIHEGLDSTLLILQHKLKDSISEIQLVKQYGPLPVVDCLAGQMNQVFMNVLGNAIDALETHYADGPPSAIPPTITITTAVLDPERVVIRIADNGPGIPLAVQPRLFDPFFTTKPIGKGTGLGLSISYQIVVAKHGGELRCHSVPGQGTEFWIELPMVCDGHRALGNGAADWGGQLAPELAAELAAERAADRASETIIIAALDTERSGSNGVTATLAPTALTCRI
jgi:two-component system, NtrC family, sensor kinase